MKRLLGLAVTLSLLLISFIKNAPATASAGGWDDGFSIADLGVPTGLVNGGNLDCSYVTFKSRYVFNEKIINNKLTYDSQTYETTGRDYPDVCSVQNDHGIIGSNGLWAKDFNLEKALPITSAPYSLSPIPGGNSVLFFDSAPGGGLEYSINHSLGYLGSLSTVTYGRGVSARKEKIWKIDTSKLDQFLTYSNASVVGIDQVGFSSNGRFMVAQLSHRGLVRIELQTKELVPFYAVNYANGVGTYLQISNDGRYVSSYKTNTDQFYIHDISGCSVNFEYGLWPATGVLPTDGCKSTKYFAELQLFNPTVDLINGLRFSPNGASLRVLARFRNGSAMVVHELRLDAKAFTSSANGYLAMGDSYSSGEGDTQGAYWYEEGTDKQGDIGTFENRNLCHLSRRSYPYLSAVKLGYLINNLQQPSSNDSFHSVACSGAKMHNIIGGIGILELGADISDFSISDNQYLTQINAALELWQPGINSQKDYLQRSSYRQLKKEPFNPEIITIGIGGNDAGFGQKLAACLMPGTCEFATSEDKRAEVVEELAQERDNLTRVYKRLKIDAPDARIYVVGYPQFVTYPMVRCGINVQLNEDEVRFVHSAVSYFNQVIASAASSAGVTYVDIENSLSGKNLCSGASDETIAFNGVTAGNDRGLPLFGAEGVPYSYGLCVLRNCIGSESFHPNQRGHEIFSDEILRQTSNLNAENPNPLQTEVPLSEEYFGLSARSFVEALNDPNSEQQLRATFKEMITDLTAYRSPTVHLEQLLPYSTVEFTIHSEPVSFR